MKKHLFFMLFLAALTYVLAAEEAEATDRLSVIECADLATVYGQNPFAFTTGQLDRLWLCLADHMALIQREREEEKRNATKLEDAE